MQGHKIHISILFNRSFFLNLHSQFLINFKPTHFRNVYVRFSKPTKAATLVNISGIYERKSLQTLNFMRECFLSLLSCPFKTFSLYSHSPLLLLTTLQKTQSIFYSSGLPISQV